jgi:hypothetical protein
LYGGPSGGKDLKRLSGRSGLEDAVPGLGQEAKHGLPDDPDVIDDENALAREWGVNLEISSHDNYLRSMKGTNGLKPVDRPHVAIVTRPLR